MTILLTRDGFRNAVFARDNRKCLICGEPAVDAHHILERRLFPDGGYYLANGASVCEAHHLQAEATTIDCDVLRNAAGIKNVLLPEHLDPSCQYDKWGNPVLADGTRLPGELFYDDSVQKILAHGKVLHLFSNRIKYPRTFHLPWSPGASNDDKILKDLTCFENREIVITEKMDGENTSMYSDYIHARSINYNAHPSRSYLKALHAGLRHDIPQGWRICGENVYALHSIAYDRLPGYFMLFSVWDEANQCLSWDDTLEWAGLLGLPTVPVIYRGPWDSETVKNQTFNFIGMPNNSVEGYVVRLADSFPYKDFRHSVAKYVRANHVQTDEHWLNQAVVPNRLA